MQNHATYVDQPFTKMESDTTTPEFRFLDNRTVDVFFGKGWDHWSRFEKRGKNLVHVAGARITYQQYGVLLKELM